MKLSGVTVLVTRQREQSRGLVREIEAEGGRAVVVPLIRISDPPSWHECDEALLRLASYDAVIITSANAAEKFLGRAAARGVDEVTLAHLPFIAVGRQTGRAIKQLGGTVAFVPSQAQGQVLAEELIGTLPARARCLLPRGDKGRGEVRRMLEDHGFAVDSPIVYVNLPPEPDDLRHLKVLLSGGTVDVVVFASPSAVRHFVDSLSGSGFPKPARLPKIVAIGATTAGALRETGLPPASIAESATPAGFIEAIKEAVHQ